MKINGVLKMSGGYMSKLIGQRNVSWSLDREIEIIMAQLYSRITSAEININTCYLAFCWRHQEGVLWWCMRIIAIPEG